MTDTPLPVTQALDRAIDRIMGVEIEAMDGDNLAVMLCGCFDSDDGGEPDDNGWSQSATDAYEEIKQEIAGLFVPVREAIAAWNTRASQPVAPVDGLDVVAWIVSNANGDQWRVWQHGFPAWSKDRNKATRYARREDAEAVHAEDEDAWRVEPYGQSDAAQVIAELVEVAERILDRGYISSSIEEERGDHDALVAAISAAKHGGAK